MRSCGRTIASLAAAIGGLCLLSQANAAVYTWTGQAPGANADNWVQWKSWSNPANSHTYPTTTADSAIFAGAAPTSIVNIPATAIGGVTVTSGNYNLNGLNVNALTLNGGGLNGGTETVNTDYTDSGWAITANAFSPKIHTTGATVNAAGTNSLLITLPDLSTVAGGGSGTLNLGTIFVGQNVSFTFQHTQASGLTLREAFQTPNFGGVLSLLHGATPVNQTSGELTAYAASATETYTLVADAPGSVSGNFMFVSNFDNPSLAPITISVTGDVVPVPEPSSAIMVGIAAFYAASRWRRRD